jgi:hypothetical protein
MYVVFCVIKSVVQLRHGRGVAVLHSVDTVLLYCIRLCGNRVELREKLPNQLKYNYVTYV